MQRSFILVKQRLEYIQFGVLRVKFKHKLRQVPARRFLNPREKHHLLGVAALAAILAHL